ncbi:MULTISPECIES: DUF6173 family protein [unclassified Mesorhizobium]|uniref:DUF6173 family protein n=1 Tax=unclassified Mesorhizobium TaxID=325217 RepID=UPI00117EA99C|nr:MULTISPECIES: DUF6173 family protein [unclassified Mesorhizobium]
MARDFIEMPILSVPRMPRLPTVELRNPARSAYQHIIKSIIAFEKKLDANEEIGARLVNFGMGETVHIEGVGYWEEDFLTFYGKNADGNPVELIQHVSQLNVLLVAIKVIKDEPNRIGFVLAKQLKEESE